MPPHPNASAAIKSDRSSPSVLRPKQFPRATLWLRQRAAANRLVQPCLWEREPIVDRTGLTGQYDLDLEFNPSWAAWVQRHLMLQDRLFLLRLRCFLSSTSRCRLQTDRSQFSVGRSARSMASTSTEPLAGSSFRPSCSRSEVTSPARPANFG